MFLITPHKKYRIVVQPHKNNKEGDVIQEPVHVVFEDGIYDSSKKQIGRVQMDEKELLDFITSLPNFGVDFYMAPGNKIPEGSGYQGNKVQISRMESEDDRNETPDRNDDKYDELQAQVTSITSAVNALLKTQIEGNKGKGSKKKKKK